MSELFRHKDPTDPYCHDEVYVLEVEPDCPDLGLFIGARNPDEHVCVQIRRPAADDLLDALTAWKNRADGTPQIRWDVPATDMRTTPSSWLEEAEQHAEELRQTVLGMRTLLTDLPHATAACHDRIDTVLTRFTNSLDKARNATPHPGADTGAPDGT